MSGKSKADILKRYLSSSTSDANGTSVRKCPPASCRSPGNLQLTKSPITHLPKNRGDEDQEEAKEDGR